MRWRTIRPMSHRGNRYTFQFQGSEGASWKQRRKESSTTADAASCSSELMSSSSCLPRHKSLYHHSIIREACWSLAHYCEQSEWVQNMLL